MEYAGESLSLVPPRLAHSSTLRIRGQVPEDVDAEGRLLVLVRDENAEGRARDRIMVRLNWFQELARLAPHPE